MLLSRVDSWLSVRIFPGSHIKTWVACLKLTSYAAFILLPKLPCRSWTFQRCLRHFLQALAAKLPHVAQPPPTRFALFDLVSPDIIIRGVCRVATAVLPMPTITNSLYTKASYLRRFWEFNTHSSSYYEKFFRRSSRYGYRVKGSVTDRPLGTVPAMSAWWQRTKTN